MVTAMDSLLSGSERQQIITLYADRFKTLGRQVKAVGWSSEDSQRLRFEVLCRNLNLKGKRILDVGCGLGDFVSFLNERTSGDFQYIGIDIVPDFIEQAKRDYVGKNINFVVGDIYKAVFPPVDIAILSGALSFHVEDNQKLLHHTLAKMFEAVTESTALNFLSTYVDYQLDKNHHYNPGEVFEYAKTLTPYVNLLHDYPLFEFTIQLFK